MGQILPVKRMKRHMIGVKGMKESVQDVILERSVEGMELAVTLSGNNVKRQSSFSKFAIQLKGHRKQTIVI